MQILLLRNLAIRVLLKFLQMDCWGLWVIWRNSPLFFFFYIDILSTSYKFTHCRIKANITKVSWFRTFFYDFSHNHLQKHVSKLLDYLI